MITFNKTTEYALRIMSYLAFDHDKLYRSDDIYEELQIPFRYLRRLLTLLSKKGLLQSTQGKHGGFRIDRKLSEITLKDIVLAVEDKKEKRECFFGYPNCPITGKCIMHDKWESLQFTLDEILSKTTLEDINKGGHYDFKSLTNLEKE